MVYKGKSDENGWRGTPISGNLHIIIYNYKLIWIVRFFSMFEGSLEVKLPTIWTVEKQR